MNSGWTCIACGAELVEGEADVLQIGRADVRAIGEAEIDQHQLAAEVRVGAGLAGVIDQGEGPPIGSRFHITASISSAAERSEPVCASVGAMPASTSADSTRARSVTR